MEDWATELTLAGPITATEWDVPPQPLPDGRKRHAYGEGPFAVLRMPALPEAPGLYVWCRDGEPVYVGQTRSTLKNRLGSRGYARISNYNTFARQPGRTNGGQQTNCRINALANSALQECADLTLWYRVTPAEDAADAEAQWMRQHGLPAWNRQDHR